MGFDRRYFLKTSTFAVDFGRSVAPLIRPTPSRTPLVESVIFRPVFGGRFYFRPSVQKTIFLRHVQFFFFLLMFHTPTLNVFTFVLTITAEPPPTQKKRLVLYKYTRVNLYWKSKLPDAQSNDKLHCGPLDLTINSTPQTNREVWRPSAFRMKEQEDTERR